MTIKTALAFLFFLLSVAARSQGYTYMHYDIREGLAGSTVYCMLQDKQGYLWFGTETGVSRFDGVHFKNFTTFEGLPDNQVLTMFEDSKGRIWMSPFNKSICYYYKGKIYNQHNDPVLQKLNIGEYVQNIAEDKRGNIILQQTSRLHIIKPSGQIKQISRYKYSDNPLFICAGRNANGNFAIVERQNLLELRGDTIELKRVEDMPYFNYRYFAITPKLFLWRHRDFTFRVEGPDIKAGQKFMFPTIHKFSIVNDTLISANNPNGAFVVNLKTGQQRHFLPQEAISTVMEDDDGSLWFCTLGHGVYRLNSVHISNYDLVHENGATLSGYSIARFRDGWLIGSDMGILYQLNRQEGAKRVFRIKDFLPERATTLNIDADSNIWIGTDSRFIKLDKNMQLKERLIDFLSVKSTFLQGDEVFIASSRAGITVNMPHYKIIDTFFKERGTAIFVQRDTIYIGTLNGLYSVVKGKQAQNMGDRIPELSGRIMDMKQSTDSILWIATFAGLHAFKDGHIVSTLTEKDGLISNFCRVLDIYKNELWVGTNKGLQKIDISNPAHPIPGYSLASELASSIINAVEVDSSTVVVATPEGVNIVDKFNISRYSSARLNLDAIIVSGKPVEWHNQPLFLSNRNNNIRFEFAGISYRSAGDIKYKYRLLGLDSNWRIIKDNALNYPTLPGGQYELQLIAINKFGVQSKQVTVDFFIEYKLWQKWWFQFLLVAIIVSTVWILVSWRIRNIRRKEAEKNNMRKKIAELEQLALKSQMNPHFVFNSLNSIQHYVLDKDIEGANKFISGFSRLIRQTLDVSARHDISLEEEMRYLSTYLQLEQIRLEYKFTYEVVTDTHIAPEDCHIPPLILQPFVENSIRHGIRFRNDNAGKVSVRFSRSKDYLECSIEDNGVGRKVAAMHKGRNPIEYQSKGISLTTNRINLLNRSLPRPILLNIYDLEDSSGQSEGTRVIISFPIL